MENEVLQVNKTEEELCAEVIAAKEELCKRAEEIAASEDLRDGRLKLSNITNEWKSLRNYHTDKENELWDRLAKAKEAYNKAKEGLRDKNKALKQAIVDEAEKLLENENFKEAGELFKALMERWKSVGSAGKEADEELWKAFNEKRDIFRTNRSKFFEGQEESRKKALEIKEALIKKAQEISDSSVSDFKKASDEMNSLFEQWKAAGFAGREVNDELWDRFTKARQGFFDKRSAEFEERDAKRLEVVKAKEELIAKAKEISEKCELTPENIEAMKALDAAWKQTGFAGRERENELWETFRDAKEPFWQAKHRIDEEKHKEWLLKAKEIIKKKEKQISDLHGQIKDLESSIKNSTNWDRISKVRGWIDDKKAVIAELRKDISELSK